MQGKVTDIQGSTLHTVLLKDGRSVRRHTYQLRSRIEKEKPTGHSAQIDDDFEYSARTPRNCLSLTRVQVNRNLKQPILQKTQNLIACPIPLLRTKVILLQRITLVLVVQVLPGNCQTGMDTMVRAELTFQLIFVISY